MLEETKGNWWEVDQEGLKAKIENIKAKPKKRKKTGDEVRDEIRDNYRSHFATEEREQIKITHNGTWKEQLQGAFITGQMDVSIETVKGGKARTKKNSLIRLDNMEELQGKYYKEMDGDVLMYFPEGIDLIKVNLPVGRTPLAKAFGKLQGIALQVYALNPQMTEQDINDYLVHLYTSYVKPSEDFAIVAPKLEALAKKIHDTPLSEIKPSTVKVKIIWNPDYDLTRNERLQEANKVKGANKSQTTTERLKEIYMKLEKPTQKNVAAASGMGIATIKRHWKIVNAA